MSLFSARLERDRTMITSVLLAHLALRADPLLNKEPRYGRRFSEEEAFKQPSLFNRGIAFLGMTVGVALLAFLPALLAVFFGLDSAERNGQVMTGEQIRSSMVDSLLGAVVVGLGISSFVWALAQGPNPSRDKYESDERMR
ncbi:hypothetical protein Q3Y58_17490 [Pseudovibrio sp. SPO723]|nr:hypothetical protein [Pseudovibrio sp. SPO723]